MLAPDDIAAWTTVAATLIGGGTTAYVRASRRARRTLRAARRTVVAYREALETAVDVAATNRRIAINEGVDARKLRRMPRKVVELSTTDGDPPDQEEPDDS